MRHCSAHSRIALLLFESEGTHEGERKGMRAGRPWANAKRFQRVVWKEAAVAPGQAFRTFGAAETEANGSIAAVNVLGAGEIMPSFHRKAPHIIRLDSLLL